MEPGQTSKKRATYETARLKLAHLQLESAETLSASLERITQTAGDALEIDRAGIWFLRDGNRELVCREQFERAGRRHSRGTVLSADEFPTYMRALTERRAIVADDARTHEHTCELTRSYLAPNDIASLLDAPIIRGDSVIGVVCHERLGTPRAWSQREIDFAGSVADIVALMLEQADRVELQAALKLQTEQRLEQQKLDAIALLASSVAHDLNNVLSVFLATADEVRGAGLAEAADSMCAAVDAGKRLSNQLLELGGRRRSEAPAGDLSRSLKRLLGPLRSLAGPRIRVELELADPKARSTLGESDLERVLFNLVANARDAIGSEGNISISVRPAEPEDEVPMDFVVIEVCDDGAGMDRRTRAHLFEPYFTTKPDGHGLGLATTHGIITRAGGKIDVASEPGVGSSFRIAVPRTY